MYADNTFPWLFCKWKLQTDFSKSQLRSQCIANSDLLMVKCKVLDMFFKSPGEAFATSLGLLRWDTDKEADRKIIKNTQKKRCAPHVLGIARKYFDLKIKWQDQSKNTKSCISHSGLDLPIHVKKSTIHLLIQSL